MSCICGSETRAPASRFQISHASSIVSCAEETPVNGIGEAVSALRSLEQSRNPMADVLNLTVNSARARRSRSSFPERTTKEWWVARILIAEDDPLISAFLEKGFRAGGFSTFTADDGEQALRLGLTEEFDLLLLDMGLPEKEGFHVLQELRARGKALPVFVLTGRGERDVVACLEAGADDYMRKPFHLDELLARVRARLRARGSQELQVLSV